MYFSPDFSSVPVCAFPLFVNVKFVPSAHENCGAFASRFESSYVIDFPFTVISTIDHADVIFAFFESEPPHAARHNAIATTITTHNNHIGGDECPKSRWKKCPFCQQRIRENGLKNEEQLQGYLVRRIEQWLKAHGRNLIGWDEILQGGVTPSAAVMSWREPKYGISAAQQGNHVIMAPWKNCYLDYYQTSDPEKYGEPLAFPRYLPARQVYRLDPYDQLTPAQQTYILGVQGNLWAEFIADIGHAQRMLLPRLAALAEVGWAYDRKDYNDFVRRMPALRRVYDAAGFAYSPFLFEGIE